MKIEKNRVVSIHYTLKNDKGEVIDTSDGKEPLSYLHDTGSIIPGLEEALTGREAGYSTQVSLQAKDAYGEYNEELIQTVPQNVFEGVDTIEPGMQFQTQTADGQMQLITVKEVNDDQVVIDGNHPLAGENLHFDISIQDVREASAEELDHGHAH